MATKRQIEANRRNARLSTGPRSRPATGDYDCAGNKDTAVIYPETMAFSTAEDAEASLITC